MDTQGFDQEVFAGALEIHNEICGFQSEVGIKRIYDGVAGWSDQIRTFQEYGFDLTGIFCGKSMAARSGRTRLLLQAGLSADSHTPWNHNQFSQERFKIALRKITFADNVD